MDKNKLKKHSGFSIQPGVRKTAKKIINKVKAKNRDKAKIALKGGGRAYGKNS